MIVSVCVDTVACAPRWRRLGFNDCKGSGFGVKHQTAKGKVASHAQPQTPEHPAPSMPSPSLPNPKRPSPKHAQASSLPHPFRKPNPPTPRKPKPSHPFRKPNPPTPFESQTLPPRESHFRAHICARQEPAKNPSRTRQEPAKRPPSPAPHTKKTPPGKPVIQASVRRFVIAM